MKNFLTNFIFSIFICSSFQIFGMDYFDVENTADSMVGKLWRGTEIPEKDIHGFLKLVDQLPHKNESNKPINELVSNWQQVMIDLLKSCHNSSAKKVEAVKKFASVVQKENFSSATIDDALSLILEKY